MPPPVPYTFVLNLTAPDGTALAPSRAEVDWTPAVHWAHLKAIRAGRLPAVTLPPPARIEPVWHAGDGAPRVAAVRITLEDRDAGAVPADLPLAYFADAAKTATAPHIDAKTIDAGATCTYTVSAFAGAATAPDADDPDIEPVAVPMDITAAPRQPLDDRAHLAGPHDDGDLPVYVPRAVLAQTRDAVLEAGDVETGGVLLGHLRRDPGDRGLFIEITAQVPARHAPSTATQLTFTPDTWSAARTALRLRDAGETAVGWWHSHPWWCRGCPPDRQASCPLAGIFFSAEDCALHRTVFPRADQVALLLSHREGRIVPALFGWRHGRIASRGWHTLDAAAAEPVLHATVGGKEHARD